MWLIEPHRWGDSRGYFMETWKKEEFESHVGHVEFVQDNESMSGHGVVRGLHFQCGRMSQAKLVRVTQGEVIDVAVDLRPGSPTYGRHVAVTLSADNARQLFVPRGFAHGFVVLSDYAEFCYKVTDFYHPNDEGGLLWKDSGIGVQWPMPEGMTEEELILSDKDKVWGGIEEYISNKKER